MSETGRPPAPGRPLTWRDCRWRVALFAALAAAMVGVFFLEPHEGWLRWVWLVLAATHLSGAWTWWRYCRLLRHGRFTVRVNVPGLVQYETTTVVTGEPPLVPVLPAMPVLASALVAGLLTLTALGWAVLSWVMFTSPRGSWGWWLFAAVTDALVGGFTVYCWRRVAQDVRSRRA